MSVFVKICGLTQRAAVCAAIEAKADAIGFVFHKKSKRYVTAEQARQLCQNIDGVTLKVAVAKRLSPQECLEILTVFKPDVLQLDHDAYNELELPRSLERLPVFREPDVIDVWPEKFLWEGKESGVGKAVNWDHASLIAKQANMILAGGLTPKNVAQAIRLVRPFGVDVSSGVEDEAGLKSVDKIYEFVANAKRQSFSEI
jgi:phosphoribosylanthranilate isomerase